MAPRRRQASLRAQAVVGGPPWPFPWPFPWPGSWGGPVVGGEGFTGALPAGASGRSPCAAAASSSSWQYAATWSAPPAAAASAWNAGASARWPWSSPCPALQAWHNPCLAAPDASGPATWSLGVSLPELLVAAAAFGPWVLAAASPISWATWPPDARADADAAVAARSADAGARPLAAAATPPIDSRASAATATVLTRRSLLGIAALHG